MLVCANKVRNSPASADQCKAILQSAKTAALCAQQSCAETHPPPPIPSAAGKDSHFAV